MASDEQRVAKVAEIIRDFWPHRMSRAAAEAIDAYYQRLGIVEEWEVRQYRKANEIRDEEWLGALTEDWQYQKDLFVKLGGDPADHDYARLSLATWRLREAGHQIESHRNKGLRLAKTKEDR